MEKSAGEGKKAKEISSQLKKGRVARSIFFLLPLKSLKVELACMQIDNRSCSRSLSVPVRVPKFQEQQRCPVTRKRFSDSVCCCRTQVGTHFPSFQDPRVVPKLFHVPDISSLDLVFLNEHGGLSFFGAVFGVKSYFLSNEGSLIYPVLG